ncbi:adenylate/guanylate cyclase domain-containing protein [Sedimentitalea sp. HM32M-2]|uniref:adenylate/guanylate cyclase domain-containing protein n=1 Tax=Sedimentitalea sp. HM32M-2 TaxID=3351566 RepID=UPI00363FC2C7
MRSKPQTRFTKAGEVAIAYQVVGKGPIDLVYASGWLHNIDVIWEHPGYNRLLSLLAEKCRLILFDKRGTGMSDRNVGAPTLEQRADDIRAVMDAAGSDKATLFGVSEGGNMTTVFAATYPERVRSIVLAGCFPCRAWKPDWPLGARPGDFETTLAELEARWGDLGYLLELRAPSVAQDAAERAFINRLFTQSASPGSALALTRLNQEIDIRPILPAVQVPALVLHSSNDRVVSVPEARYLAENLPNAELRILDREDHMPWIGDVDRIAAEITGFACSASHEKPRDRVLVSILMTDIVGSTDRAAQVGDAALHDLIEAHDAAARRAIACNQGRLVKTLGDGVLATFPGPSRVIAAARMLSDEVRKLGLSVRAGLHAGECLRRDNDISGLAVTVAARLLDVSQGNEIWVSETVRDLVVGSDLEFQPAGVHRLKGVPGDCNLYKLHGSDG